MLNKKQVEGSTSNALYKDKYCKLDKSHLRIRNYYFPTTQDKEIKISKIEKVYFKRQDIREDCCRVKRWGMALTAVWWARDLTRSSLSKSIDHYNVAIDTGSGVLKGFTVIDIDQFLAQLSRLIDEDKFIADQIPS